MYTKSRAYLPELESHMLKNSEWGAVAYLAESKYGRNGTDIAFTQTLDRYTGGGDGNAYITNANQSSTGNVYGIYDLVASYEYVASAYSNQSAIGTTDGSTKYATVYNGEDESTAYKYGDATYETNGWHQDFGAFVTSTSPFFMRGGGADMGLISGIFCYMNGDGVASQYYSFRLVLVV